MNTLRNCLNYIKLPRTGKNYLALLKPKPISSFVMFSDRKKIRQIEKNCSSIIVLINKECLSSLKNVVSTFFTFALTYSILQVSGS